MSETPRVLRQPTLWILEDAKDKPPVTDFYEIYENRPLGEPGEFGRAVMCRKLNPNPGESDKCAVKIISKAPRPGTRRTKEDYDAFKTEVEVMQKLKSEHVIGFHDVFEDKNNIYIVMELCTGGELFDRIINLGRYSERDAARVLRQIFQGLAYLHKNKIMHGDLKPENFLFLNQEPDSPIKIIDFGFAKHLSTRQYFRRMAGTAYYVAPEVLDRKYNESSDIWSMGVIMFLMLHGYAPFNADPKIYGSTADQKIFELIRTGFDPTIRDKGWGAHFTSKRPVSENARDLISKILVRDTKNRLSAEEVLEHPWMNEGASDSPIDFRVLKGIQTFKGQNQLRLKLCEIMAQDLSEEDVNRVQQAFQHMDVDRDGVIIIDELRKAMLTMNSVTSRDLDRMMQEVDVDGDGVISYSELLLVTTYRKLIAKEERLWDLFCRLDKNHDGKISAAELQEALDEDPDQIQDMIRQSDLDGDGQIDYSEFLHLWGEKVIQQSEQEVLESNWEPATALQVERAVSMPHTDSRASIQAGHHSVGSTTRSASDITAPIPVLRENKASAVFDEDDVKQPIPEEQPCSPDDAAPAPEPESQPSVAEEAPAPQQEPAADEPAPDVQKQTSSASEQPWPEARKGTSLPADTLIKSEPEAKAQAEVAEPKKKEIQDVQPREKSDSVLGRMCNTDSQCLIL